MASVTASQPVRARMLRRTLDVIRDCLGTMRRDPCCPHSMAFWTDDDLDRRIEEVRRQIRDVEAAKASIRLVCPRVLWPANAR